MYGVLFTGTGLASLLTVGLVLSPIGDSYIILFYLFGLLSVVALLILVFLFRQERFEPDWQAVFQKENDTMAAGLRDSGTDFDIKNVDEG